MFLKIIIQRKLRQDLAHIFILHFRRLRPKGKEELYVQ